MTAIRQSSDIRSPEPKAITKSARSAATVMLENYRSWHLEQATTTMRLMVVKCPALKRMGEQGKFNLPA